ncbi:MAG: hypothetical protein R2691_04450 [Solirubrobacterales bacterium]
MTAPDEQSNRPPPTSGGTGIPFREGPQPGPTGPASEPDWSSLSDWAATHEADSRCLELCPICRGAEILRAAGGTELRGQLDDVGREMLLTLRSLIDHYLERLDQRPGPAGRVEHIPID